MLRVLIFKMLYLLSIKQHQYYGFIELICLQISRRKKKECSTPQLTSFLQFSKLCCHIRQYIVHFLVIICPMLIFGLRSTNCPHNFILPLLKRNNRLFRCIDMTSARLSEFCNNYAAPHLRNSQ